MKLEHTSEALRAIDAELAVVGAFAEEQLPDVVAGLIEPGDFKGGFKQTLLLYTRSASEPIAARRLLLVGLGKRAELTTERVRQAYATAAQKARELQVTRVAVETPRLPDGSDGQAARALAEGFLLALYRFDQFKGNASKKDSEPQREIERITIT